ncbi:Hypothetical predicted protein [Cloeon dipterum]|uniref:Uncharacterized protein n=1 Tax=Cloeon dipterum TaxID=197152 RepID=A0A8S1DEA8_9INSE|nr:Hypothetical predicted protein [Cloeon dipterum]
MEVKEENGSQEHIKILRSMFIPNCCRAESNYSSKEMSVRPQPYGQTQPKRSGQPQHAPPASDQPQPGLSGMYQPGLSGMSQQPGPYGQPQHRPPDKPHLSQPTSMTRPSGPSSRAYDVQPQRTFWHASARTLWTAASARLLINLIISASSMTRTVRAI